MLILLLATLFLTPILQLLLLKWPKAWLVVLLVLSQFSFMSSLLWVMVEMETHLYILTQAFLQFKQSI